MLRARCPSPIFPTNPQFRRREIAVPRASLRCLCLSLLAVISIPCTAHGGKWGVGTTLVSGNVYRETWRSGVALQPSAWTYVERAHTLLNAWSSVRLKHPRLDDIVLDSRTGLPLGSWGWLGGTVHWNWISPSDQALGRHSLEVGSVFSWFTPPYRPTFALSYDILRGGGLLMAASIPYTIRLGWIPPATFIPEVGLRSGGEYGRLGIQYASFTALVERRVGRFVIIPMASVVPRGRVREWLIWGGVHLGATR